MFGPTKEIYGQVEAAWATQNDYKPFVALGGLSHPSKVKTDNL